MIIWQDSMMSEISFTRKRLPSIAFALGFPEPTPSKTKKANIFDVADYTEIDKRAAKVTLTLTLMSSTFWNQTFGKKKQDSINICYFTFQIWLHNVNVIHCFPVSNWRDVQIFWWIGWLPHGGSRDGPSKGMKEPWYSVCLFLFCSLWKHKSQR